MPSTSTPQGSFASRPVPCSDPPKADDPQGLATELDQRVIPEAPVGDIPPSALVDRPVVMGHMMADFQKQGTANWLTASVP